MSWRLGISSGACTERPILDMLPAIEASGVRGIEVGTPPQHFNPMHPDQVEALGRALRDAHLEPVSIHAPFGGLLDLAEPNAHHRHAAIGAVLTAASAIRRLGGGLVVVHPSDLERHGHDAGARLADSARSLQVLSAQCRQEGVRLLVESPLPHLVGGHPDEFAWLLGQLDDTVGVCLDTGHTFLSGAWRRFVEVAGARLAHVHANDNHGTFDDHLPPGDGRINWHEIADTLRAARFEGWIMLELRCPGGEAAGDFRRAVARAGTLLPVEVPT
jgi:sugar phosphate isomerase/epimerase